ncbi:MAG: biotin/lipoyl-containing protein [Myxococcales bacterium]|jgi:acetyl-CoA carboxylase biotin carboxyl carrier protein
MRRLLARVDFADKPERVFTIRSPAVGLLERLPSLGSHLGPDRPLVLRVLGEPRLVELPAGVEGWVTERLVAEAPVPVEYGQPLLRLSAAIASKPAAGDALHAAAAEGLDRSLVPIIAPSEGVFYRRPRPDAPPYVDIGSEVAPGTVLGIVEVMKCFSQVTYGGPGLPQRGKVARILVDEAAEVSFGQVLFLMQPE